MEIKRNSLDKRQGSHMGLFDGLESLGFSEKELQQMELYKPEAKPEKRGAGGQAASPEDVPMNYLYAKDFDCPVCGKTFVNYITRKSKLRLKDMELDLKANYLVVNANCYDVYLCPHCGYAALSSQFNHITDSQANIVLQKIRPFFKPRDYPAPYSLEHSVERYKMALYCAVTIGTKAGLVAIICIKIAWLYRDLNDKANELQFINGARTGLQQAYNNETFPIGTMDELTVSYMIGELSRRLGDFSTASKWVSAVLVAKNTKPNLKERAYNSKELIRARVDA
jgi:uncharacterized protein (DUF2225 family)